MVAIFSGRVKLGDRVVGQNWFRGTVVSVDENATKWPYTVEDASGRRELFNGHELVPVVDEPIDPREVKDALALVEAEIEATETKLEGLKLTRRVLEGFKS